VYAFTDLSAALRGAPARPAGFPHHAAFSPESLWHLRCKPHLQAYLSDLRAEAERARVTPVPHLPHRTWRAMEARGEQESGNAPYSKRRRRLLALALHRAVFSTDNMLAALEDPPWLISEETTWAGVAHLGLEEAFVMLYEGSRGRYCRDLFLAICTAWARRAVGDHHVRY